MLIWHKFGESRLFKRILTTNTVIRNTLCRRYINHLKLKLLRLFKLLWVKHFKDHFDRISFKRVKNFQRIIEFLKFSISKSLTCKIFSISQFVTSSILKIHLPIILLNALLKKMHNKSKLISDVSFRDFRLL